jgi:hypothetical protein
MIVDRHVAYLIASRQITQHRVPADLQPPRRGRRITIAVHREHRAFDPACLVAITSCTRSRTGHEDTLGAGNLAELGHETLASYARWWLRDRDQEWLARRCPPDLPQRTTLEAVDHALDDLDDATILARWRDRWADRNVWVIDWEVLDDQPRLLAQIGHLRYRELPSGRWVIDEDEDPDGDLGYTTRVDKALTNEPEAVDVDDLNPGWARAATRRHVEAQDASERARRLARDLRAS